MGRGALSCGIVEDDANAILAALVLCIVAFLCFGFGFIMGRDKVRGEAARQGAAEYRADPITGKTEFVWRAE